MKKCPKCHEQKPETEFHKCHSSYDGLNGYCKPCTAIKNAEYYAKNKEYHKEALRQSHRKNRQKRTEYKRRWRSKNPELARKLDIRSPEQRAAHAAIYQAVKAGWMIRPDTCSKCGDACKPRAHHPNYFKRFNVIWLCTSCGGERRRSPVAEKEA